eukprot:SAG11_NODE_4665_length_1816_cov_1.063483_2_plen_170_part_00
MRAWPERLRPWCPVCRHAEPVVGFARCPPARGGGGGAFGCGAFAEGLIWTNPRFRHLDRCDTFELVRPAPPRPPPTASALPCPPPPPPPPRPPTHGVTIESYAARAASAHSWRWARAQAAASRQFRFKELRDAAGVALFELEHETRTVRHFQFMKAVRWSAAAGAEPRI